MLRLYSLRSVGGCVLYGWWVLLLVLGGMVRLYRLRSVGGHVNGVGRARYIIGGPIGDTGSPGACGVY